MKDLIGKHLPKAIAFGVIMTIIVFYRPNRLYHPTGVAGSAATFFHLRGILARGLGFL